MRAAAVVWLISSLPLIAIAGCGSDDATTSDLGQPDASSSGGSGGTGGGGAGSAGKAGASGGSGGGFDAGADAPITTSIIPPDRRIDWRPGVPGGLPDPSSACPSSAPSVTDFGAVGDGTTDSAAAFQAALDAAAQASAVRVPAGTYLIRAGLTIDKGVVLCGEGADQSHLVFDGDATAVSILKYDRGDFVAVSGGYTHGSSEITVADGSSFVVGQYAELQQDNDWSVMDPEGTWQNESWVPEGAVGQMFKVEAINANTLSVDPPVTINYSASFNPRIRRLGLVEGAGLQGLHLSRLGTYDQATVLMKNAVGCWIRDCVGENTSIAHVTMESAIGCEVRDSYFHHAFSYGGNGHGYGVTLGLHVTGVLVENNIFVHLRHSMMVQVGATANVFGYNYSREPFQDDGTNWTPCDISLHGHYPSMNLFEGNTAQEVDVSDYWGPSGPGNTFFRNRVQSEGIEVMDYSHGQNLVGNELSTGLNIIVVEPSVTSTLQHANYQDGAQQWDPAVAEHTLPASLYQPQKPAFFGSTPWPVSGGDLAPNGGAIPAQQRYDQMN